jgi:protein gp37
LTDIEWCQNPDGSKGKTWNPVRGCSRVSAGCTECYAMKFAHRFSNEVNGQPGPYQGLTTIRRGKVDWAGFARLHPEMLGEPFSWRKPQRVFVNSMSMRELYRAQGFRDNYQIDGFTQKTQNRLVGNSVVPQVARAIVAANLLGERAVAA